MRIRSRSGGTTLLEALVSVSVLGLLMSMMFAIYRIGAVAWKSGESDVQLAQSAQLVTDRIGREAARSANTSVALDPPASPSTAVSFLSPIDPGTGRPDYDASQRSAIWHSHSVFYHDVTSSEVRQRSIDLATPTAATTPLANLSLERTGGTLLAREVSSCEFFFADRTLEIRLVLERKRYGNEAPDRVELNSSVVLNN